MIFFGRSRRAGPLIRAGTPRETFLRLLGLILVFSLVSWLFWVNSKSAIRRIEARGMISDQVQGLTGEDRRIIRAYAQRLKDEFGLELKVLATNKDLDEPTRDGKTIFLAVAPHRKEAVLLLPTLASSALGEEEINRILRDKLLANVDSNHWQAGVVLTLDAVWRGLERASEASP